MPSYWLAKKKQMKYESSNITSICTCVCA
uniref:Uncharacterized protein n=1 Tax=Rhizophora mucronata TaxID=61149 RepID=A0A2P2QI59_RHIMU